MLLNELLNKGIGHFLQRMLIDSRMECLELSSWCSDFVILLALTFLCSCFENATILV